MPRPEKVRAVEEIRQRLESAEATFVTEYRGLTVPEQQALRRGVRAAHGEFKVLKMSLARRAADELGWGELSEVLYGPTALAFADGDPVPVAKALRDFAVDHEALVLKLALFAGEVLPPERISRLADIEPREVLLSKIAGAAAAPLANLASMLQALLRNSASVFSQLLDLKRATAPEAPAEPAAAEEAPAEPAAAEEAPAEPAAEAAAEPETEDSAPGQDEEE